MSWSYYPHGFTNFQSSEFSNVFWPIKLFEVWTNATTTNKQTRLDKIYVKIRNLKFVIPCGEQLKVSCFIFYIKKNVVKKSVNFLTIQSYTYLKDGLVSTVLEYVPSGYVGKPRTTDAQRGNSLHCTAEN